MICPNCQTDVAVTEQHYGALYTCTSCQAVYFIGFDGQPVYGEEPAEVLTDLNYGGAEPDQPAPEPEAPMQDMSANGGFEASLEPLVDSVDMVDFDNKLEDQFASLEVTPEVDNSIENPIEPQNDSGFEALPNDLAPEPDFSDSAANPFEPAKETPAQIKTRKDSSFSDAAKEISSYGNTEVQLAGMNYDLKVIGIDTQETAMLFKEAIEDSKFGWDANEVMKGLKNGQIEFKRLSPVKAYILAKRIQFLDIEKLWKQNVLS
ncbi:MAG: hypothetical protein ABL930_09560 [Pseudobdellovibrio sp.]